MGIWMAKNHVKYSQVLNSQLIQIGDETVNATRYMTNVGMYFDTSLAMMRRVNAISSTCYYHVYDIDHHRQYVVSDSCKTLAHALITS